MTTSVLRIFTQSRDHAKPVSLGARISAYRALRRQRQHLAQLDLHMLNDIGITRAEAVCESCKPAWDVPNHWHN
jgi:uncharacterized protein YjiS (DUF1127 family)